jgi:hypothetical protein
MRTAELVIFSLIVVLMGGALLLGEAGGDDEEPDRVSVSDEELARVAGRVERLRGERFKERPRPRIVSSAEARREAIAELDRSYPPERRAADEELLKLLGLLEPDDSLREIEDAVFGGQVAGYYDTRRDRLSLVEDVSGTDAVTLEITLAHELVHALEDQRFDLREPEGGADDEATAYTALVEGTATSVGTIYAQQHIDAGQALVAGLSALGSSGLADFEELPAYVQAALLFPYLEGERFVTQLHEFGDGWRLVDYALRRRPPDSTEQILHPEKYIRFEEPRTLRLRPRRTLGPGWRRASRGSLGEFDTGQLLRLGDEGSARGAAEGWGGGTYESWRLGGAEDCEAPCRERRAVVVAWTWDSRADAREFAAALPAYLEDGLGAHADGDGRWSLDTGAAAVAERGAMTTLALAPSAELAERLASRALAARR